jgi:S-adenosylmethionine/arginine decarboxylase-like enzyme
MSGNEQAFSHNVSANNAAVAQAMKKQFSAQRHGGASTTIFLSELQHSHIK